MLPLIHSTMDGILMTAPHTTSCTCIHFDESWLLATHVADCPTKAYEKKPTPYPKQELQDSLRRYAMLHMAHHFGKKKKKEPLENEMQSDTPAVFFCIKGCLSYKCREEGFCSTVTNTLMNGNGPKESTDISAMTKRKCVTSKHILLLSGVNKCTVSCYCHLYGLTNFTLVSSQEYFCL